MLKNLVLLAFILLISLYPSIDLNLILDHTCWMGEKLVEIFSIIL